MLGLHSQPLTGPIKGSNERTTGRRCRDSAGLRGDELERILQVVLKVELGRGERLPLVLPVGHGQHADGRQKRGGEGISLEKRERTEGERSNRDGLVGELVHAGLRD